jgi:elongation factor G
MSEQAIDQAIADTRVIGIFAHIDAGKTTTSEGILYYTGRIHRMGRVDNGNTQLDWMPQERERGITITAAATTCTWRNTRINLIDTPGHIDFTAEVIRSMRVIDGCVIVLCGVGGVEAQTETVWLHAGRQGALRGHLPRLILVNKLDRLAADYGQVLASIHSKLTPCAVALHLPIGREDGFCGMVELLEQRALIWPRAVDAPRTVDAQEDADAPTVGPVPESLADDVRAARAALVEAICATDDRLLETWLAGHEPLVAELKAALRRATLLGLLVPVLAGSALRHIGLQPLLDAIADYLPSPLDGAPWSGTAPGRSGAADGPNDNGAPQPEPSLPRPAQASLAPVARGLGPGAGDAHAPFSATAFKIVSDPYVGHTTWVRVHAGVARAGDTLYNPRLDLNERVSRIYRLHANRREAVDQMVPGDVVALVGPRGAISGDALCDPQHPAPWSPLQFPDPVIMAALIPGPDEDADRVHQAVARLCQEDPTLVSRFDAETGEETLAGMGELHLEVAVDRLRREYGLALTSSPPQVAYRETVARTAEAEGAYIRQSGGSGHFARVRLRVEALPRGSGVVYERAASAAAGAESHRVRRAGIPPASLRSVETGVREVLQKGVLAGYPLTDVRVTVLGGQYHEVDSSPIDFHIAASMAVRQAARAAGLALLEPIMRLDVQVGQPHMGSITADLWSRRGRVTASQVQEPVCRISGEAPLAETYGYATALRDMTHGHGAFTLEFRRYDLIPEALATAIVARRQAEGRVPERG